MKELGGRVAVITGGASGIGRATGELLARNGMKVVLGDIEQPALDATVKELQAESLDVSGVRVDVSKLDSMDNLCQQALERHGKVHVVFLNAGVGCKGPGQLWDQEVTDWSWGLAVHLWGVINGIKAFVPTLLAQGEPGHVIGTSSSNGAVVTMPSNPIYSMAKAAMVSVMESLYGQLAALDTPVRASVLVPPGVINTNLFTARRNRQPEYAPVVPREELPEVTAGETIRRMNERGNARTLAEPDEVAEYVLEGLYEERFWILPKTRHGQIKEQFDTLIRARADTLAVRGDPAAYLYK